MHEGASSGVKSSGTTSLQRDVPTKVTYSNGDIIIALQEVLAKNLQFHNGTYLELPASINSFLIICNLPLSKNTTKFFDKLFELSKSTLLTLLLKMKFTHTIMLTVFQKKPLLQKMILF